MSIPRQWVALACLAMLFTCRTPMKMGRAGAPAARSDGPRSDGPNEVAPANPCGDVAQVAAGLLHACALKGDGTLWCWGANEVGQLGNGMSGQRAMATTPVRVASLGADVVEVCAGMSATCARGKNGGIWCWGARAYGMMGDGNLGVASSEQRPFLTPGIA
ncbi:MAG TPA: hypothetical protein VJ860_16375 [Polyangia bacterium]|nr:hypothetical protein [Polyangia bacterium]